MSDQPMQNRDRSKGVVLLTGATGYVGGRLGPRLLEAGYRVRCLTRSARKLAGRPWATDPGVEIVELDLADGERVKAAMQGCCAGYYLVHSMLAAGSGYRKQDRRLAEIFSQAAAAASLRNRVVCQDGEAAWLMPQRLLTVREALDAALDKLRSGQVESSWCDAGVMSGDPPWAGGTTFSDRRTIEIRATPARVFETVSRLGGQQGYYTANWLWWLRGFIDRVVGGPGLRRGRRDPERLAYGDAVDFWRVIDCTPNRRLELKAEMRLPGVARLCFEIEAPSEDADAGRVRLTQTALFRPLGLLGVLYWYAVMPLHGWVFKGMMQGIKMAAERTDPDVPVRSGQKPTSDKVASLPLAAVSRC